MRVFAFTLVAAAMFGGAAASAQKLDPRVPTRALRHMEQIIWPRSLFDSAGRPEPGFVRYDGLTPEFSDLHTNLREEKVQRLPGFSFSVASAYPSLCSHCATRRAAVAHRDTLFVPLAEPDDISDLVTWAEPPFAEDDSVAMKDFIVQTLAVSCLLGCEPLQQVQTRADLEDWDGRLLRPVGDESTWQFPRTYTHHSTGQLTMEFVLYRPAEGLYRVEVRYQRGRPSIHITRAAFLGLI